MGKRTSIMNERTLLTYIKAAGMTYDFFLLAAGSAGLGRHLWHIQETDWPRLSMVGLQSYPISILIYW